MTGSGKEPVRQLRVLSAGIIEHRFGDVAAAFGRETGHGVTARFNPSGSIVRWVESGEPADVVVVATEQAMARLIERGLLLAETCTTFARAVIGVAVRAGAPDIDISTPAALIQAMRAATAFAHADPDRGSSSGAHVRRMIAELGIDAEVAGKIVMRSRGQATIRAVAEGAAEFVIAQSTEIAAVEGVRYLGPLPASLQTRSLVGAGVHAATTAKPEAQALIGLLAHARMRPHWHSLGFADP